MHQLYSTDSKCWPLGQHPTSIRSPHDRAVDRSASARTSCLAELHTVSAVLSILLTVSSPPPLKRHHHAAAAAMISRFHKVYAGHKHRKASGPTCHCCICRGCPATGADAALAHEVSPLPCAKRKPASADGNCQRRPHQRTLHMCWHIIIPAGTSSMRHARQACGSLSKM